MVQKSASIACVSIACLLLTFALPLRAEIDPDTLVGLWLFEEGGGETAKDASENGNDGKIVGDAKWVAGKFGQGLQYDGASVYVEVQSNDSLVLPELTIVAWGQLEDVTGLRWQSIMMKGQNPRNYLLAVDKDTQTLQLSVTKGAPDAWGGPIGGPPLTDGEWHHMAGVIGEDAGYVIYTDGIEVGRQGYVEPSLDANPSVLRIGDGSSGGHLCEGILDEVGLFNVPLEAEDIMDIMQKGLEETTGKNAAVKPEDKLTVAWAQLKADPR